MRLFVPDEPDTVENNIQYRAFGAQLLPLPEGI